MGFIISMYLVSTPIFRIFLEVKLHWIIRETSLFCGFRTLIYEVLFHDSVTNCFKFPSIVSSLLDLFVVKIKVKERLNLMKISNMRSLTQNFLEK